MSNEVCSWTKVEVGFTSLHVIQLTRWGKIQRPVILCKQNETSGQLARQRKTHVDEPHEPPPHLLFAEIAALYYSQPTIGSTQNDADTLDS